MRISWGTKIAMLYSGFVIMILALVITTFRQNVELVTDNDNYYQQEVGFQKHLDAARAANALHDPLRITANEQTLTIRFPERFASQTLNGKVLFYAPTKAAADRSFELTGVKDGQWTVSRQKLAAVPYEVQVNWTAGETDYFEKIKLNLQQP